MVATRVQESVPFINSERSRVEYMRTHFANSRLLLLAPVSQALYEGAVLGRVEMAGLRKFTGEHVQPRIRPEVEQSVKVELRWPRL